MSVSGTASKMFSWDFNCRQYVDLANFTDDDKDEEFFDVRDDGPVPSPTSLPTKKCSDAGFKVQQVPNLIDISIAETRSSTGKRHSYTLRRTSARRKNVTAEAAGATPNAKKARTSNSASEKILAPLILNKSAGRIKRDTSDRSFSVPPTSAEKLEGRKRHASETIKAKTDLPTKAKKLAVTRVQPFRFATDKRIDTQEKAKRKREEDKPYVGLAEQVLAFQNRVPDRFRSIPQRLSSATLQNSLKLTKAVTPRLRTNMRSRPTYTLSQAQKEEEELQELQKCKFKATPFDPSMFVHTKGIPMVKSRLPTRPVGVNLATDKRSEVWKKPEGEEVFRFKARPVPKKVLEGPVTAKPPTPQQVTQPKSPAFALKLRQTAWQKHQEELAAKEQEKNARRKPRVGSLPAPQSPYEKGPTVPVPFSFDSIDKKRWAKRDQKIKELAEKENQVCFANHYQFQANPMPSPSINGLPPKPKVSVTQPEPFQLMIDERGQKRAEQWQQQMEEEMRKAKEAMAFKAQPSTVLGKEPFVPEKAAKPLTECTNVRLNTEKRAEERDHQEELRRQMEVELEELKAQKEAEMERRMQLEIRRMRAEATHKAQPVPAYHPPQIRPSDKPLTKAQSPRFSTRLRCRK